jgi:hypothetical protein
MMLPKKIDHVEQQPLVGVKCGVIRRLRNGRPAHRHGA